MLIYLGRGGAEYSNCPIFFHGFRVGGGQSDDKGKGQTFGTEGPVARWRRGESGLGGVY